MSSARGFATHRQRRHAWRPQIPTRRLSARAWAARATAMHRFCRFCSRVPVRCAGGHARPAVPPSVAVLVPGRPPASHRMRHDSLPYSAALCRRAAVLCHRRFPRRPRLRPTHRPFALLLLTNFSHSIPISLRAADQPDKTPPPPPHCDALGSVDGGISWPLWRNPAIHSPNDVANARS